MNSKRSKRHKSAPKKSENIKDDGAEVFVLPPNLLEKLGIQLGNIQSTHECPTQTYKNDLSAVRTKLTSFHHHDSELVSLNSVRSSPVQKETSILETASLMKESVFLSPTFVPTVANVNAGEVEIANGCKQSKKPATATIDEFDTEHNLVDSFDIQQIMNSNNENGVIEFAEKILQSHENQIEKLQVQEKDMDKCEGIYSITRDANIDTTIAIQDVPVGLPSQNIDLKTNTNKMEIVQGSHWIQGTLPSIESNIIKKTLNESTISTDTQLYPCMDKQIPEEKGSADDIEDCEKITLEDLEINKSLHDNLLSSEIESFQADFLNSVNCENDSKARIVNMFQSEVTIIKAENTAKNKIQLISQEIVNLKDCKIASPLNINNLIPVTIDTIISTRKDNKSENHISKHIENYKPLSCDFNHDKIKENTSHVKKKKYVEKMACIKGHNSVVITDHDSMDLTDKIQSQGYSKGADLDSNNEIIIPKHVNTISLLSVNKNTKSNVLYDKSVPHSNYTLDTIPCTKSEENVANKPEIQKVEFKIPSNHINITPEGGISLIKHSHTGLISNDASIGSMTKIKLDEEIKRKNKPSLVNAKRNKEKANQSINEPSKTKSCVQGVEKPGGDNPVDPIEFSINKEGLKTYQRVKKTNKEMNNYSIGCVTLNVVFNNDIDSHENRVVDSCDGVEEYCLCNDFGHLTNYDDNEHDVYEHIHFWQTESVRCDPEIIFGIYYEDIVEFNDNSQGNVTDVEEIMEKETTPICWQAISTKKSDNVDDEESSLFSCTDNTRESQPLKNNQEQNYISETKVTTEVLEHCTNLDDNINIPSPNEYESDNSNLNAGTAVNELISETNVSKTNMSLLQPSVIGVTRFSETNNEKANVTAKLHLITNAEVKSKNLKNNITSHQLKPHDDEKHMQTVSENNQLEDASPSHPNEQLLQVPLHQPKDDIFSYQTNKDSQLENMDVVNVNMSNTNVINKTIIDPQPDNAVQIETPMDIQELNLTCEKSTQEPVTGLKGQRTAIEAVVSASDMNKVEIPPAKKTVYCGVCTQLVAEVDWTNHATQKHNSIAWKFGQTIDFDDEQFLGVLIRKIKKNGILECSICNFKINHLATFILHLEQCVKTKIAKDVENLKTVKCAVCMLDIPLKNWSKHLVAHNYLAWVDGDPELVSCQDSVRCGVCSRIMDSKLWNDHIKEHNYLAWKDGEPALDLEDDSELRRHLSIVSKQLGELTCQICGQKRKNGKKYLVHIRKCKLGNPSAVTDSAINSVTSPEVTLDSSLLATVKLESTDNPEIPDIPKKPQTSENVDEGSNPVKTANTSVVCGVCNNNVEVSKWITHIEEEHDYLGWKLGEKPLDLENESEVLQHLKEVMSKCKVLVCKKCGLSRKYAKHYMNHIKQCDGNVQHANTSSNTTLELNTTVECSRLDSDSSRRESTDQVRPGRRRKRAQISSDFDEEDNVVLSKRRRSVVPQSKSVCCGVCKMDVLENTWYTHIEREHHYLAWKEGETPLNMEDEKEVWSHLLTVSQILDKLVCYKCNYSRKKPKVFLKHIKNCSGTGEEMAGITDQSTQESISANEYIEFEFSNPDVQTAVGARVKVEKEEKTPVKQKKKKKDKTSDISEFELVTCAVCKESVKINIWIQHIKQEHNYLAWIEGKPALNLNDEDAVREHLRAISKKENGLVCNKCEIVMKYPKAFLKHVENCSGEVHSSDLKIVNSSDLIKCGVCSKDIESRAWIKHIQVAHNYLAWRAEETPIDLDDENAVRDHLTKVLRSTSHLICAKCGFTRRYAVYYMSHLETCKGVPPAEVFEDKKSLLSKNEGLYECAMCHKKILPKHWKKHAFDEHYNVTWIVGDIPIDLKSPYGADKYLKEYQKHNKLVCNICGESRASLMGFYVHIITCGKTEEQMDIYKEDCTVCGQRYFGVYRSVHMATHRQQEITKSLESEMNVPPESDEESPTVTGRRKAAEKANSVIEKYQKSVSKVNYAYKCDNCSFGTDLKKHFQRHKCDLDVDAASEQSEDEESDEYVEHLSDLAEEEEMSATKKEGPRSSWMSIRVLNWDAYYERLINSFRHIHLTKDILFSEWLISQYSFVSEDQVKEYMPKLQQSCKVLLNRCWVQFEIFEGKRDNRVHSMFVGGSIKRIRWVPCELDPDVERNFLAVSAHLSKDVPRHNYDEVPTHPGLIQIWDMGAFNENAPKLALGVAHDYGVVWDMDWCPSGARGNFKNSEKHNEWSRLGLLAIACSNGSAYILSVPYPDSIKTSSENLFVKLKHVAELRICSTESDRKRYQATAISWSKKKNHSEIVVAYSDGTIARYDLANSSPLLKTSEDDVTIYYPYHDERSLNACVTGVDSFPGHGSVVDAVCGSSPTGAVLAGGGPYAARVTSHLPSSDAQFTPAWPTAMISSDEGLLHVTPNELDWHGYGRKLSTLYGGAACGRCGRVIAYTPPLLRVARHFPPWSEINRRAVATINVVLLSSKRKLLKQTTDELSVKIEPITYEDCVNKYGVEFNILQKFRISGHLKEPTPERFPLADVTSMAYCTSEKFHDKVAVATYSGHIFIFKPAA